MFDAELSVENYRQEQQWLEGMMKASEVNEPQSQKWFLLWDLVKKVAPRFGYEVKTSIADCDGEQSWISPVIHIASEHAEIGFWVGKNPRGNILAMESLNEERDDWNAVIVTDDELEALRCGMKALQAVELEWAISYALEP